MKRKKKIIIEIICFRLVLCVCVCESKQPKREREKKNGAESAPGSLLRQNTINAKFQWMILHTNVAFYGIFFFFAGEDNTFHITNSSLSYALKNG